MLEIESQALSSSIRPPSIERSASIEFGGTFNKVSSSKLGPEANSAHDFILDFGRYDNFHLHDQVGMNLNTHLILSSVSNWSVGQLYFAFFYPDAVR